MKEIVDTYFAPAERASDDELRRDIEAVSKNPVVDALMDAVGGMLAVLNEQRQVVAINDTLLEMMGIEDAGQSLGLRLGETLDCVYSDDHPGGCGTSVACATCGAAIATVVSLASDKPEQRECVITTDKDDQSTNLYFEVRSCPITFDGQRFLLLFLRDISTDQQRAALERVFFHDLSNIILSLQLNGYMLEKEDNVRDMRTLAGRINKLVAQLAKEVTIQKTLSYEESHTYQSVLETVPVEEIVLDIQQVLAAHPAASGKSLHISEPVPSLYLHTDALLLQRVLINMLVNAFEATGEGGQVRLWLEQSDQAVTFCVWSERAIPPSIAQRIFQRSFSTKPGSGRGLGTFSMKLFGETYLGGLVDFTTSKTDGTVFYLGLPINPPAQE